MAYAQTDSLTIEAPTWKLHVGGALRFNYNLSTWKKAQVKRGGDFGFDVFRINVDASYRKLEIHAEQRFYSAEFGGAFMKYGFFQYPVSKQAHVKLGLIPAYWGAQQYNSHSWFFALPYYLGFEDDHDMGVSYDFLSDDWQVDVGFYKNAEELSFSDSGPISDSRYGYDLSGRHKEANTLNARVSKIFGPEKSVEHRVTLSGRVGQVYDIETQDFSASTALGLHYQLAHPKWSVKAYAMMFEHRLPAEVPDRRGLISMSAYGAPYDTPAEGRLYGVGLGYTIPVKSSLVKSVQLYNDFGYLSKSEQGFADTQMNVLGALLDAGAMYIYVDAAMGRNQPWLGPGFGTRLGAGDEDAEWSTRFNVNFGYYF